MVRPYTQAELVDLSSRFRQKLSEAISAWLLHLWDLGVDGIVLSGSEMGKLASLTVQPALRQQLQNAHQTPRSHSLLDWFMAALCAVWPNPGDLPFSPVRWQTYAELQQVLRELGMRNAIYSPENYNPDEEIFTTGMKILYFKWLLHPSLGL